MSWKVNIGVVALGIILCRTFLVRKENTATDVLASMRESGYHGNLHYVTTEDGYILGLQRITGPEAQGRLVDESEIKNNRPPVLFVHGLESSAMDWIYYLGNKSLPYLLFEEGYDVWLGNVRGTLASYNHTTLNPHEDADKFWDSSFHEIGYYDLPAMIDYILNITEYKKIFYVGMSQGEATFLILTSTRPEYNEKIQLASLSAPSSHLKHSDNSFFKTLGRVWPTLQAAANIVGLNQVPGRNMLGLFCQYRTLSNICRYISHSVVGYENNEQLDLEANTRIYHIYPIRSALKQILHYLQIYDSGIFRKYDYGKEENLIRYSSEEPPEYDLTKVSAPIAYFWGENDCWSRPKDVEDVEKKLSNLVLSYKVPNKLFNHYDVLVARDAKELVYDKIIETIKDKTL